MPRVPSATRRPVQERVEKRHDRCKGLVQRPRHWQEGASCFGRVSGFPQSLVRDGKASRQLHATPLGFRAKSGQLWLGLHGRGKDNSHKVDKVSVAGRRSPGGAMPLEYRSDLIRDVIDKRIDPVSMLLDIRHDHAGQRRDVLRVAGHAEILSEEINVKGCPFRISHEDPHGEAGTAGICQRPWRADLEAEPVANVQGGRLAQVGLGNLPSHLAVEVDVDSPRTPMSRASNAVAPLMIQPSSMR